MLRHPRGRCVRVRADSADASYFGSLCARAVTSIRPMIRPKSGFRIILISFVYSLMPMFISDNSEFFTVRRSTTRPQSVPRQDARADDDGRAGGHLPLNLCTHSTSHSADTSECISTTSWMQQSGVYRRQTACRLIVVSGELVALSSLAQHRCRFTAMPLRSLPGDQNGDIRCSAVGIGMLLDG